MQSLSDLLATFAARGAATAFVQRTGVRRRTMSYGELADAARRMATLLERHGVQPGDRVLLWAPNSPWWGVVFWGCVARGAVVVPVDFLSGRERAAGIAQLTGARLAVQSRFKLERLTDLPTLLAEDLPGLLREVPPQDELHQAAATDLAELIYTSGTTGNPKGVMLSHGNLVANLQQALQHLPVVDAGFTFLSLLPLSHMFEQLGGFLVPLCQGGQVVYLQTLKPSAIMEAFADEQIHAAVAVPRLLQLLRDGIERELAARGLAGLYAGVLRGEPPAGSIGRLLVAPLRRRFGSGFRMFVSGGAPLDPALFRFWEALGLPVIEGYGLTECSPVLAANSLQERSAGAVGRPLPGVEIRLVEGEVQARGPNVFSGYYQNPVATAEAFSADGWFRTGDLGNFDAAGNLLIRGRAKELIVTGAGINVYPDELEKVLNRLPGVREACVVGLDRGQGEEVHGVVIPDGSGRPIPEIIEAANRELDELHSITGWSLWPEAEFPKTTTMKVQKFLVKQRLRQAGGEEVQPLTMDRLCNLISQVTSRPLAEVREEAVLVRDLGLTSIGRLELVTALEREFRLDLDEELVSGQTTVADLRLLVGQRRSVVSRLPYRRWLAGPLVCGLRRLLDLVLLIPLVRLMVRLEVVGTENLAAVDGPCLIIANHLSYLDQPVVMQALPASFRYRTATAAWAEFFFGGEHRGAAKLARRGLFELCTVAAQIFPMPQRAGFRPALAFMGWLADTGWNMLVFPEGERSRDGRLLPFMGGLGVMVRELDVPVVPVVIDGLERVLPRGGCWPRPGKVRVCIGRPRYLAELEPGEIVARARQALQETAAGQ